MLSNWRDLNRYVLGLMAVCVVFLLVNLAAPDQVSARRVAGEDQPTNLGPNRENLAQSPMRLYLPLTSSGPKLSTRLGYSAIKPITGYPEINSLRAGWYVDWQVQKNPIRPWGIEYVPLVRVHQKLKCALRSEFAHDRSVCPYAEPYDYLVFPSKDELRATALARPGLLWLIGNEIDRRDWALGGQDEILPEVYAVAYHDIYALIKQADPTARIANAGVIQPTPLRLGYLNKMWDAYLAKYGTAMPVDVWNVHNFILQEQLCCHGASIPPGSSATEGAVYISDRSHVDLEIFKQQIRTFRTWMRDHGQQNKPLIISEYGVLYYHDGMEQPKVVQDFMLGTFDYLLNARDCTIGYPADDCRLVQRWAWYSLDDAGPAFNKYGALFDPVSLQITETGVKFRSFSLTNLDALRQ